MSHPTHPIAIMPSNTFMHITHSQLQQIVNTLKNNFKSMYTEVTANIDEEAYAYIFVKNRNGKEANIQLDISGTGLIEDGEHELESLGFRIGTDTNSIIDHIYSAVLRHLPADYQMRTSFSTRSSSKSSAPATLNDDLDRLRSRLIRLKQFHQ